MQDSKVILDTNAILRYILDDVPEQADIVEETIAKRKIIILPEVIAEVVYIFTKYYKIERKEAVDNIIDFLDEVNEKNVFFKTSFKNI